MKNDLRKSEKLRHEFEMKYDEVLNDLKNEHKLKEKAEEFCVKMQQEHDRFLNRNDSSDCSQERQEIDRLNNDLVNVEVIL